MAESTTLPAGEPILFRLVVNGEPRAVSVPVHKTLLDLAFPEATVIKDANHSAVLRWLGRAR